MSREVLEAERNRDEDGQHIAHANCQRTGDFVVTLCGLAVDRDGMSSSLDSCEVNCEMCITAIHCPNCKARRPKKFQG